MKIKNIIQNALDNLTSEELHEIRITENKKELIWFHNNIGQNIRNDIGLWYNEDMCKEFEKEIGIDHPDDISMYIIEEIWDNLQAEMV